jgi:hypothetical protein
LRPKPSPDAKPLPEHLIRLDNINANNRKDGVPEIGDPFHDPACGQKWAEFHAAHTTEIRNSDTVKVDVSKPNQLWYYLGRNSTEAKPQYTDDFQNPVHNPKSSFLDSVKPAAPPYIPRPSLPANPYGPRTPTSLSYSTFQVAQRQQDQSSSKPYVYKPRVALQPLQAAGQNMYSGSFPNSVSRSISGPASSQTAHQLIMTGSMNTSGSNASRSSMHYSLPSGSQAHRSIAPTPPPINAAVLPGSRPSNNILTAAVASLGNKASTPKKPKLDNSPPYQNFYTQAEKRYTSQQVEDYTRRYQTLSTTSQPAKPQVPAAVAAAPITSMLLAEATPPGKTSSLKEELVGAALSSLRNLPAGNLSEATELAHAPFTPPSQRPETQAGGVSEYMSMLHRYPFMLNSFLRQPQQFEAAPKSAHGRGVAPNTMFSAFPRPNTQAGASEPAPPLLPLQQAFANGGQPIPSPPVQQPPTARYQTNEQFSAQVKHAGSASGNDLNRFNALIQRLNKPPVRISPAPTSAGTTTLAQKEGTPMNGVTPGSPERPVYSPISDCS